MIPASELKLDNWYSNGEKMYKLNTSDFMDFLNEAQVNNGNVINIFPVPLSPDILLKAGFEFKDMMFSNSPMRYFRKGWFILFKVDETDNYYMPVYNDKETELDVKVTCLHQLQNLYYSLTNQELNIQL